MVDVQFSGLCKFVREAYSNGHEDVLAKFIRGVLEEFLLFVDGEDFLRNMVEKMVNGCVFSFENVPGKLVVFDSSGKRRVVPVYFDVVFEWKFIRGEFFSGVVPAVRRLYIRER